MGCPLSVRFANEITVGRAALSPPSILWMLPSYGWYTELCRISGGLRASRPTVLL